MTPNCNFAETMTVISGSNYKYTFQLNIIQYSINLTCLARVRVYHHFQI